MHVLSLHSGGGVYHQYADVGMLYGAYRAHHRVELEVFAHLGLAPDSGGVDQHEFIAELVVVGLDRVPRRTCHGGDYVPVFAEQGVGERGLADIGLPHDRDARESGMGVGPFGFVGGQGRRHGVEQFARPAAVGRRDAEYLPEPERVELVGVEQLVAGIHLVDAEYHRLPGAAQYVGDLGVVVGYAGSGLHHEYHGVGFIDGYLHL